MDSHTEAQESPHDGGLLLHGATQGTRRGSKVRSCVPGTVSWMMPTATPGREGHGHGRRWPKTGWSSHGGVRGR